MVYLRFCDLFVLSSSTNENFTIAKNDINNTRHGCESSVVLLWLNFIPLKLEANYTAMEGF